MVLGYELVGKLVEVGEEAKRQGYNVGDKVIALNKERYGGLAERCITEVSVSRFHEVNYFAFASNCKKYL